MPQKPPAPHPAPPIDCDSDGVVNQKETRLAMRAWDKLPHWRCGHVRRGNQWSKYDTFFGSPLSYWAKHADSATARDEVAQELRERSQECPTCAMATRQLRQRWAAGALVAGLLCFAAWSWLR
jgi:hypothetical protein